MFLKKHNPGVLCMIATEGVCFNTSKEPTLKFLWHTRFDPSCNAKRGNHMSDCL